LALVQDKTLQEGLQSLKWGGITSQVAIYQPLAARAFPVVWTDFRTVVCARTVVTNPVLADASTAGLFVDGAGHVVVKDGAVWRTLTNQVVTPAPAWNRFTISQDFTGRTWALYLNGMRLDTHLAMAHSAPDYSGFRATGPAQSGGFLDALTVTTNAPDGMDGVSCGPQDDPDGDGLDNLSEFQSGSDPLDPDSDGDGVGDGMEVEAGYSPVCSNGYMRVPFDEDFEQPAVTNGMLNNQNGWRTDSGNGIAVQNRVVWEGSQALELALTNRASHVVAATGLPVIWCDFHARLVPRLVGDPPPVKSSSAGAFYLDHGERLVVCSGAGDVRRWEPVSGVVSGATSRWVRITVGLDYSLRRWALWCDGVRVAQDLEFANPVPEFSRLCVAAPWFSTGYVDHLSVSTNEPPGLDTDGDGLPDAWERAQGLNPEDSSDASADPDFDGLASRDEYVQGTDPFDPDTDGDGLVDGHDGVLAIGLFPQGVDRNGDGYADGESDNGCDPLNSDTDGDGLGDGAEVAAGLDPDASTLGDGLTAWFKLDETNGVVVADSSPQAIDGIWCGPAPLTGTPGRMGRAVAFDGLTNGILIPRSGAWDACSNFSLSVWVLPQAETTNPVQVAAVREGQGGLLLNQRRPEFRLFAQGPALLAGPEAIPAGAWSHLCLVCKEGQASLYVDGVKVAATNGLMPSASRSPVWTIGYEAGGPGGWFCGKLDDVRLYNRELTAAEVAELAVLGSDPDADTVGVNDALQSAAGTGLVWVAGDLDGDGLITAADRARLGLLVAAMTGRVTRLSYDGEGNLIAKTDALGATSTMTYDPANRLVASTDARGNITRSERDPAGAVVAA
ncbi:MAG: LamG-like jellyroll fold domain-containing protein, partial [bacterium]